MVTRHFRGSEADAAKFGLQPFAMERLGKIVVLAGANGSGKTRLLRFLRETVELQRGFQTNRYNYSSWIELARQEIRQVDALLQHRQDERTVRERTRHRQNQIDSIRTFEEHLAILQRFSEWTGDLRVHSIAPRPILDAPRNYTQVQAESQADLAHRLGDMDSSKYAISYINKIYGQYWDNNHQLSSASPDQKASSADSFQTLELLLFKLLGVKISFEPGTRKPLLFGRSLSDQTLSNGQKILVQLAVDIHAKGQNLSNTILILDEPELHLHPSAAIDVVERLAEATPSTQLWIATHCVPLLSHLHARESASIFYMKSGTVEFAGTTPSAVLESLLGDEQRMNELREYVGFADRLAITNFAAQCLLPPPQMGASSGDPQVNQIAGVLETRTGPLRILDFGAGKGRLLESLRADAPQLLARAEFYAFEKDATALDDCRAAFARQGHANRVFDSETEILNSLGDNSVDVVVLCNVLHEIDPDDWPKIFSDRQGVIRRVIKNDGYVLLVEDMEIPKGEHAHKYGFFILDTDQLRALFNISPTHNGFAHHSERGGRLKAHLLPADLLSRLTPDTRKEAIERLRSHAQRRIEELRATNQPTFRNGRLHAFWLAQFANASLWLSKHSERSQ